MNTRQILIAAAAAAAAYFVARAFMGARSGQSYGFVDGLNNNALPGQPGWGWQYFENGTAISPEGVYYHNGQEVWRPQ